jgi:hypothetical protein
MSTQDSGAQAFEQEKAERNIEDAQLRHARLVRNAYPHDPVPDGRTGWANRIPHLKNEHGAIGDTYDARCKACRIAKGVTD